MFKKTANRHTITLFTRDVYQTIQNAHKDVYSIKYTFLFSEQVVKLLVT